MESGNLNLLADTLLKESISNVKKITEAYKLKFGRLQSVSMSFTDSSGEVSGSITISKVDDSTDRYELKASAVTDTTEVSIHNVVGLD